MSNYQSKELLKLIVNLTLTQDFGKTLSQIQQILQLDDLEMARILKVSRPTVNRWMRGISVPHDRTRQSISFALFTNLKWP